jgi:hypothetical protein
MEPPSRSNLPRKIVHDLGHPQHAYRLTYTLIDMDGTRRIGEQRYTMVAMPSQRTQMKQGSRIPLVIAEGKNPSTFQITYLDVGMNFDITLTEVSGGLSLRTKVERSGIAEERSGVGLSDPVVRQSLVEGTSIPTPDRPLIIGSFDIPDSTRHLDVQVSVEHVFAADTGEKSCHALSQTNILKANGRCDCGPLFRTSQRKV